jgi:hypothetical protein
LSLRLHHEQAEVVLGGIDEGSNAELIATVPEILWEA